MTKSLYDKLGVGKDSTSEEIKKAYRDKSKKAHPDKEGGSDEEMAALNEAYLVLSDPAKRQKYDTTGSTADIPFETKFNDLVNYILVKIIESNNESSDNIISLFLKQCQLHKGELIKAKNSSQKSITKIENVIKRMSGGEVIKRSLQRNLDENKRKLAVFNEGIAFMEDSIKLIKECSYETDSFPDNDAINSWYLTYKNS